MFGYLDLELAVYDVFEFGIPGSLVIWMICVWWVLILYKVVFCDLSFEANLP